MNPEITVYGVADCEDTLRTRRYFATRGTHFRFVDLDQDKNAEEMVKNANDGKSRTPLVTVRFGTETRLLSVPSNEDLANALRDIEPLQKAA